uniref:Uncharacterized protein n=1 Tax=Anguilla anguilla TaxID=7936 RepID=A0A0E9VJA1_ANGAN
MNPNNLKCLILYMLICVAFNILAVALTIDY